MIFKFFWFFRGLLYAPFFKSYGFSSYVGKPVFIKGFSKIRIGKRVRIFPGLRIEALGENSEIVIEEETGIGQNVHITSSGKLIIKSKSTILANVFITNIDP